MYNEYSEEQLEILPIAYKAYRDRFKDVLKPMYLEVNTTNRLFVLRHKEELGIDVSGRPRYKIIDSGYTFDGKRIAELDSDYLIDKSRGVFYCYQQTLFASNQTYAVSSEPDFTPGGWKPYANPQPLHDKQINFREEFFKNNGVLQKYFELDTLADNPDLGSLEYLCGVAEDVAKGDEPDAPPSLAKAFTMKKDGTVETTSVMSR